MRFLAQFTPLDFGLIHAVQGLGIDTRAIKSARGVRGGGQQQQAAETRDKVFYVQGCKHIETVTNAMLEKGWKRIPAGPEGKRDTSFLLRWWCGNFGITNHSYDTSLWCIGGGVVGGRW